MTGHPSTHRAAFERSARRIKVLRVKKVPADGPVPWLLEGDPAIRWQTLRDLVGAEDKVVAGERARVAREGWGERLLAKQGPDGRWAGGESSDSGLYAPKWISTTYTLLTLRDFGLSPTSAEVRRACKLLLDQGLQRDGGVSFPSWVGRGETCISGMVLSILSYFEYDDTRLDVIASHLLEEQMPDGGWNCRRPRGATHASVHTTISVLEGLRLYESRGRKLPAVRAAERRGREFLLVHRLFRSHRTGNVIRPEFLKFTFPPRWHYDVLRALDHFQNVRAPRDERLAEAVEVVRDRKSADGRWALENRYHGKTYFELERVGSPSRWNTLRALRVLRWWEGSR
jgi:hypothetical protein